MPESNILYERITSGRREAFRIRTRILEDEGGRRSVEKTAATPEAEAHLQTIEEAGQQLTALYDGTGMGVNRCARSGNTLQLEYLEGDTLEILLDERLLAEGAEAVKEEMQRFLDEAIPASRLRPITETEASGAQAALYREIFGKQALPLAGGQTLPVTDIDMVPANVLFCEGRKILLDYEWTFFFPIPAEFVRYRILHYYYEGLAMRKRLLPEDWYARFGLEKETCRSCKQMEESFQNYIRGKTPAIAGIEEEVTGEGAFAGTEYLQVFLSEKGDFSEREPLFLPFRKGVVQAQIRLRPEIRGIRLELRDRPCLCRITDFSTEKQSLLPYLETEGHRLEEGTIAFPEAAPFVKLTLPYDAGEKLRLQMTLEHQSAPELRALIDKEKKHRNSDQTAPATGGGKRHALGRLENAKGAGLTGHLLQWLRDRRSGKKLLYHLDHGNRTETRTILRGWAFDPEEEVAIAVTDRAGVEIPAEIRRIRRADVEEAMGTVQAAFCGFYICLQNRDLPKDGAVLLFSAGERKRALALHPESDPAFSEEAAAEQPAEWMDYMEWFLAHRVTERGLQEQRQTGFSVMPKISIVIPLYNTPTELLQALLESIRGQSYANWELCLADGSTTDVVESALREILPTEPRIRYRRLEENRGISGNTNAALEMATGDYLLFADHDDVLEKDALFSIVEAINKEGDPDIVYTDEDLMDETGNQFYSPRFKCDFNLDLLRSINYICHLFVVRREILEAAGPFNPELDGAQDWDLILRCCERTKKIVHLPRVLYHWRASESSTAGNPDSKAYAIRAGERAVKEHLQRCHLEAELEYSGIFILFRPLLKVVGRPKVSILIPNKDQAETLRTCVDSILQKSTYENFEILILENNSTEEETFALYRSYEETSEKVRILRYEGAFNYSAINNFGAKAATGDYLLLLNNDTEVITPDWLERMLGYCQREDVGIVGAKLYYEDHTVQHCGVVIGMGGFAGHVHTREPATKAGHLGRLQAVMDVSAVTAACLMVKKSVYEEVGGLCEEFQVALNDIDFCLRVREAGRLVVCHPGVELFHYESKTRGYEETPEKHARFKQEIRRFRNRWKQILASGDPYYSPHMSLMYGDSRLREEEETFAIIKEIEDEDRQTAVE